MRQAIGAAALVFSLTACGGAVSENAAGSPTPSQSPTPAPTQRKVIAGPSVSGCFGEDDGKIFTYGSGLPGVITKGDGPVGVVITHERNGNVCTWRPLSDRLVAAGYRVLLYARSAGAVPAEVSLEMARKLTKEKGIERVFVVGGSIGATVAAPTAEKLGAKAAGVVALSGDIDAADAAKLRVPLLQIGSENDGYGGAQDMQAAHDAAKQAPDNQISVIKGGSLHASALFTSPDGPQVLDTIVAFMERHKG